jgi:hypothetical protein
MISRTDSVDDMVHGKGMSRCYCHIPSIDLIPDALDDGKLFALF